MESLNQKDYRQYEILQNLLSNASANRLRDSLEDLFFTCMSEESVIIPSIDTIRHTYYLLLFLRELETKQSFEDPEASSG